MLIKELNAVIAIPSPSPDPFPITQYLSKNN